MKDLLKNLDKKHEELVQEEIKYYMEKYNLSRTIVNDILLEGHDLACDYYENKKGYVKEIHIIRKLLEKGN